MPDYTERQRLQQRTHWLLVTLLAIVVLLNLDVVVIFLNSIFSRDVVTFDEAPYPVGTFVPLVGCVLFLAYFAIRLLGGRWAITVRKRLDSSSRPQANANSLSMG